jgi:hypothetical protein
MARSKLETEPYNLDSWEVIARDAQLRKIEDSRKIFEEVVEVFPTSGKFWKMYIEHEVWPLFLLRSFVFRKTGASIIKIFVAFICAVA